MAEFNLENDFAIVDKRFGEKKEGKRTPSELDKLKLKLDESEKVLLECKIAYREKTKEFESFKKRLEKDFERNLEQKVSDLVKEFLPVLDALEKGKESNPKNNHAHHEGFTALHQGLLLIHDLFLDRLKKIGVETCAVVGKKFEPQWQEALEIVEVESEADDQIVVGELEKGYFFRESVVLGSNSKIIRPAKVKVGSFKKKENN